jgi:4-amino-4-deoxy-L-arabinose transferase-like glycosyltransferase
MQIETPRAWRAGTAMISRFLGWQHANRLLLIFAVSLLVRGWWAGLATPDPNDGRFDDSVFYQNTAVSLVEGHGFTNPFTHFPTAQWPPGYSFFLAGIYYLFGPTLVGARLANVVLGAATVALVYLLALRLFDKRTAFASALVMAFFPGQIFFVSLVWSEVVFTFGFVLALLCIVMVLQALDSQRRWWLLAAGLLFGAGTLVRGQGFLLPIIAFIVWGALGREWMRSLKWTAATVAVMALVILPWSVRNYVVLDSPVLVSSSFGGNFYMGHNKAGPVKGNEHLVEEYGPLTKNPRAEVVVGNAGLREGLKFLVTHPLDEVRMTGEKIRDLYRDDYIALNLIEGYGTRQILNESARNVLRHAANAFYFVVLAASGLALLGPWRERKAGLLFGLVVIGVWTVGSLAFFTITRFHFPIMPVFALLAGEALSTRQRRLLLLVPVAVAAIVIPQLA